MYKKTLLLLVTFAVLLDFTGCAMSGQARRERAYRHYVAKQMKQRQKAIARAQKKANREMKRKLKNIQPSDPIVTTSVQDFGMPSVFDPVAEPQQVSTQPNAPEPGPKPPFKETTVDPITVSASDSISPQSPDQPSPP